MSLRNLAKSLGARIGEFDDGAPIGIKRFMLLPIVEIHAIHIVHESLGGRVLGQDQRVVVEFDVIIDEARRRCRFPDDGRAVDERTRMDQHPVDQQRMIRRKAEIAAGNIVAERARLHANRLHAQGIGEAPRDGLHADPRHRDGAAIMGQHQIAALKRLDGGLAAGGPNPRSGAETGQRIAKDIEGFEVGGRDGAFDPGGGEAEGVADDRAFPIRDIVAGRDFRRRSEGKGDGRAVEGKIALYAGVVAGYEWFVERAGGGAGAALLALPAAA